MHDQRRTHIGAQHGGQGRNQGDHAGGGKAGNHQPGGGTALDGGRNGRSGNKSTAGTPQGMTHPDAQFGTKGALHTALHHVDTPQEQGDITPEIEKCEDFFHC